MTDTTGPGNATGTGGRAANDRVFTDPFDAGRQLEREYRELFPQNRPIGFPNSIGWRAAAAHGAALRWALQTADTTADGVATGHGDVAVLDSLWLAVEIPVDVIDGLLADGWDLTELSHLMDRNGYEDLVVGGFSETANRLRALHQTVPGIGGPDADLLWHALAAVLAAGPAGLTDLQTLRWLQVLAVPTRAAWARRTVLAVNLADDSAAVLQKWVAVVGPDGWAWAAAGFTPAETRRLLALPIGHPDRPGPDQLAVMAALRQT